LETCKGIRGLDVLAHASNSSTLEAEAGRSLCSLGSKDKTKQNENKVKESEVVLVFSLPPSLSFSSLPSIHLSSFFSLFLILFIYWQYWGLNSGPSP
jgi:hypothetical protein